jgi:hypothetical protein
LEALMVTNKCYLVIGLVLAGTSNKTSFTYQQTKPPVSTMWTRHILAVTKIGSTIYLIAIMSDCAIWILCAHNFLNSLVTPR